MVNSIVFFNDNLLFSTKKLTISGRSIFPAVPFPDYSSWGILPLFVDTSHRHKHNIQLFNNLHFANQKKDLKILNLRSLFWNCWQLNFHLVGKYEVGSLITEKRIPSPHTLRLFCLWDVPTSIPLLALNVWPWPYPTPIISNFPPAGNQVKLSAASLQIHLTK